ncbi:C45 family autoproteolytic acyltransferase/hydrolase [Haloferacaceae archaeon DSL9]
MDAAFREQGRRRARRERAVIERAVDRLLGACSTAGVSLDEHVAEATLALEGLPSRHRAALDGMADALAVDADIFLAYALSFSDIADAIAAARGSEADTSTEECTNVLVRPSRADGEAPLVLKNRDVTGRGIRPKALLEQRSIGRFHGYLSLDTCGTPFLYQGVNDAGLVAANTNVDVERDDLEPDERIKNGLVVRRILEECGSVGEARALLEALPIDRMMGLTVVLADATAATMVEIDPIEESITPVDDPVAVRTNHFCHTDSPATESSKTRRRRACAVLEAPDRIGTSELRAVSADHANGPGPNSICQHPASNIDDPYVFEQLTTVSGAVFRGGDPRVRAAIGYPCETTAKTFGFGDTHPSAFVTGRWWLDHVAPADLR